MAMPGRLAAVPEESADCSTAAYPPRSLYRDSIQRVAVSGTQIRSTLFSSSSQFGHSGPSYSSDSASYSYPSNNSGCSSGSAAAVELGVHELTTTARRMVSDGYTQRLVQYFRHAGDSPSAWSDSGLEMENQFLELHIASPVPALDGPDRVLETWFFELDVAWVLLIRQEHGSQWQLHLQDDSGSSLQDLVERWIRGLTVMIHSIVELLSTRQVIMAVKGFGEASISKMLVFVDAIVPAFEPENLQAVLDMYVCVCRAFDNMMIAGSELADLVKVMLLSLSRSVVTLSDAIPSTMEKVRTLVEEDDSWAIEIPRGGGKVHRNTRLIVDCITSLVKAEADSTFLSIDNSRCISEVRDHTIGYLKDLLLRKSELCLDQSLRYLFLLNNSYYAAQMIEPCEPGHDGWKLTVECKKYMCSYLDVSWGHVLSCIPKSHSPGLLKRWINTPSLAKFESAFNRTYQVQKFWKVLDPRLRDFLRRMINVTVISSYSNYLKEHPELADHVSRGNSTPKILEEMLGQLFEG